MGQLQQIVYVSRVAGSMSATELRGILHLAQRGNRRRDITGLLVCTGRSFLQVLEGDAEVLTALVGSIADDPRHCGMRILHTQPITRREHGEWDMALASSLDFADEIDAIAAGATVSAAHSVLDLARSLVAHGDRGDPVGSNGRFSRV